MPISLPELDSIIHYLENFQNSEAMCLDITNGTLQPARLLEAKPELLGKQMVLLPEWSSAQGYDLMLQFAHEELQKPSKLQETSSKFHEESHEELRKILYSRRHVFKRFRSYLREQTELKRAWLDFKRTYFFEYLQDWFRNQFPEAQDLQIALQKLLSSSNLSHGFLHENFQEAEEVSESLLAEDFILVEEYKESKEQYLEQNAEHTVLRSFIAFENWQANSINQGQSQTHESAILRNYMRHLSWVNLLELQDPTGICAAQLFWCWKNNAIQVLQISSEYTALNPQDYILEKYLLECFLYNICPKLKVEQVHIFFPNSNLKNEHENSSKNTCNDMLYNWLEAMPQTFQGELKILGRYACIGLH